MAAGARQGRLNSPRVALVNESFVKKCSADEDPIGRVIPSDWPIRSQPKSSPSSAISGTTG